MSDDPQSKSPAASTYLPRERNAGSSHWVRRLGRAIADFATDPVPKGWRRLTPWMLGAVGLCVFYTFVSGGSSRGASSRVNFYQSPQGWTTVHSPGAKQAALTITIETTNGSLGAWTGSARIEPRATFDSPWSNGLPDEVRAITSQELQRLAGHPPLPSRVVASIQNSADLTFDWKHPLYWVLTPLMRLSLWIILVGFAIALLRQRERRSWDRLQRRFLSGQCPWCGYSLDGLSLTYCPECGGQPRPAISSKRSRVRHL